MLSAYYKESGDQLIHKNANECSDYGAPLEGKANSVKEKVGFLGFVLIIIILLVFMGKILDFFEKGSQIKNSAEEQNTASVLDKRLFSDRTSVPETNKPKEKFLETIETDNIRKIPKLRSSKRRPNLSRYPGH